MSQLLLIISILTSAVALDDICTSRASLIQTDRFYLKQTFSAEVELDLTNYIEEFRSISEDATEFATIASRYDTETELDDLEPSPLIPFTDDINLIAINSTNQNYMTDCTKLNAKILEITPSSIPTIQAIMKKMELVKTPIKTFIDKMSSITNLFGDPFSTPSTPTAEQITKMQDYYVQLDLDGSISYPPADATVASKLTGFCMKANNLWDRKGPNRQKWLTTLSKILPSVSRSKSWGTVFNSVVDQLPTHSSLYKKMTDKLKLNTPVALTKIKEFFNKFRTTASWEASLPSDFDKFLGYLDDFKSVAKFFKRKSVSTTTTTSSPQPVSPTPILPLMSISNIDRDRLQRFINSDPLKNNITGQIDTIPLFKHENPAQITARTVFSQYSETDEIKIYQVKPVIYSNSITTVSYVVGTFKNYLATLAQPTPVSYTHLTLPTTPYV